MTLRSLRGNIRSRVCFSGVSIDIHIIKSIPDVFIIIFASWFIFSVSLCLCSHIETEYIKHAIFYCKSNEIIESL